MKINPYKAGINFYIILIVFTFTILGCKTFEKIQEQNTINRQAKEILNTPDLSKYK
jgi:hypothetical protein